MNSNATIMRFIMIPVLIEDLIKKVVDKTKHVETRQHYAATLRTIHTAIGNALAKFDKEWEEK